MNTISLYLLQFLLLLSLGARAQNETTDLTEQAEPNDRSREAMFNLQNPSAALTTGGAFYVSNPPLAYEVDAEKAYLDPAFRKMTVVLIDGTKHEVEGRIRIIDQQVEIKVEGEVYELDRQVVGRLTDALGRTYVISPDPVRRVQGLQINRVAYSGTPYRLLINESTDWEDPPAKNMFDTSEQRRTLKSVTRYYLLGPNGATEINNFRDLCRELGLDRDGEVKQLQREKKQEGDEALYVALLERL